MKEELAFEKQLYTNLQEEHLISIKIPAALPPYSDNLEKFEWINGEVNIDGIIYKYVKRRIFKDSVEFLCVPHTARMRFENARENFIRLSNEFQANSTNEKEQHRPPIKLIVFEYCSVVEQYLFSSANDKQKVFLSFFNHYTPFEKKFAIDHPPEYHVA